MITQKKQGKVQTNTKTIVRTGIHSLAYYSQHDSSKYVCVFLHEHLGLAEYIMQASCQLISNGMTFIIPDLFYPLKNPKQETNLQEFELAKRLTLASVKQSVQDAIQFSKNSNKSNSIGKPLKFILVAYSIGAAYAFKILQQIHEFQQAYLFYGITNPKNIKANMIKTKTTVFYGTKDKIKYLSDPITMKQAENACSLNQLIQFKSIPGLMHGFMNPQCKAFSSQHFDKFTLLISRARVGMKNEQDEQQVKQNIKQQKQKKKKQQQSNCITF